MTLMKKYVTITIAILVASYVTSILLASNPIGEVHEDRNHEFVSLCEDMPHTRITWMIVSLNIGLRDAINMIIIKCKIIRISLIFDD